MLPRERPVENEAIELATFLREEADAVARLAARAATTGLPIGGTGARRRLRTLFHEQLLELARHLETYGEEGPRLYGESQRRHAAARLSQGLSISDAIEERAVLHEAIYDVWADRVGAIPAAPARLTAAALAESAAQAADVWLTYQRAETAAFQEAALLETIVHHLDEAIMVVESDGVVSYATPSFEQILGLPPRLFVGLQSDRFPALLQRLDVRDRFGNPIAPEQMPHRVALRTREVQHLSAAMLRRLDGTTAVCELYAAPVFDEDGDLRGAIMTIRDRTEAFKQTQQLEAAYTELRQMHARLLSRSRLEAIGELAGSAAHALNNQLNVMTLRLRKLLEMPQARDEAIHIERSVREIAALVGRLQEFAAVPQAGETIQLDVNGVIESTLDLVRAELGPAGQVSVHARLGDVPLASAEREALVEFLTTLLLGARDVTPAGESVELETLVEAGMVVIRVKDRGPTLSGEQIAQLFEPLAAGSATRALSLAVGRQAVLRWGGHVHVHARSGGGNTFELHLPTVVREKPAAAAERPAAGAEKPAPVAAATATSRRVLVVDDDADNAAMLADLLQDADAEAFTASTGGEGIRRAQELKPEAVLVDLLLPDMKGWEVVRAIKEHAPETRVAVVSGLSVPKEEREAQAADAVFRKPIDSEELLRFLGL